MINYFYPTRPRAFWLKWENVFFKKDESRRYVIVSPDVTSLRKKKGNKREARLGDTPSNDIPQAKNSTTDAAIAVISVADFGSISRNKCRFSSASASASA